MTATIQSERTLSYLETLLGKSYGRFPQYQFHCPMCVDRIGNESDKPKLQFNLTDGKSHCFRCGFSSGSLYSFFRSIHKGKITPEEQRLCEGKVAAPHVTEMYVSIVSQLYGRVAHTSEQFKPLELPKEFEPLHDNPDRFVRCGRNYLHDRGVTDEQIKRFNIGFCVTGRYANRVIFPIYQHKKQVYFHNRYAGDHPQKSLNPKNLPGYHSASTCLGGFDQCVGKKVVAVVEGPMDRLAPPNAVNTGGKELSTIQVGLMEEMVKKGTEEFVIFRDADAEAAHDYRMLLHRVPKVSVVTLGWGDPWERRGEMDELMETRHELTVEDEVRQKLVTHK